MPDADASRLAEWADLVGASLPPAVREAEGTTDADE